jgi:uncharacterized protein
MVKTTFKQKETVDTILGQLQQNKLFAPLVPFIHEVDKEQIKNFLQKPVKKELTVAELKKYLIYNEKIDQELILPFEREYLLLTDVLQNSGQVRLPAPQLVRLNRKNLKKIMRLNKYGHNSTYLFHKFSSEYVLKNEVFYLPFVQLAPLFALLKVLDNEQKLSVNVWEDIDDFIGVKAMHALHRWIKEKPGIQPTHATLIMSEECNLRCVYCYEPQQERSKEILDFETAKQVLRKFDRDCKITFFGGEPMLHIDLMKKICEWGWEYRNFHFEIITNGQIIDRAFFRDYAKYFTYVQLSCDGPEAAQDINRGHGSFRRCMEFYRVFKEETGWRPTLHPVLSKYSIPYLFDMVKWFYEMENQENGQDASSFRWLPGDAHVWAEENFVVYAKQLELIKRWYLDNGIRNSRFKIRAFAQAEQDLLGLENKERAPLRECDKFCSAGNTLMAVLPNGKMVACHHEHWNARNNPGYEEIDINEDDTGINHMSELCLKDMTACNACPQWGCCVCPGQFFFHGGSYTKPHDNYCRAGKMLIVTAKNYAEELAEKLNAEKHKVDYLAAGVDYLLQKQPSNA